MVPHDAVADAILRKVVGFVRQGNPAHLRTLDVFPLAIYVTDSDGFITYFNPACIDLAGRTPQLLQDRWCVTWRLYTHDGGFLPHDQCPMAVAIQTKRAVRGVTAVAERPNGVRISFTPYPTPVIGEAGELLGAVNMLIDTTLHHELRSQDIRYDPETSRHDRVAEALAEFSIGEIRGLLEEIDIELNQRPHGMLN